MLIREHSSQPLEDEGRFLDTMIFNYLVGGTDAHAKNFSLLIGGRGQVRLAPCYDLISILPYARESRKVKLAMKIGGDYLLWKIGKVHWEKAADEWKRDPDRVFDRIIRMASAMPEAIRETGKVMAYPAKSERNWLHQLMSAILERSEDCLRQIKTRRDDAD